MRDAAAEALDVEPTTVAVAETGTIGVPLDIEAVTAGVLEAVEGLSARGGDGVRAGDHDHRQGAEALHGARRRGHRLRPGKGRRDDRAGLRHDALLRPDGRR